MDQELYQLELRDLKTWQRKCRRLNRVADLMTEEQIIERATLLASENGIAQWYDNLRAEAKRNTRPVFLTGIVGAPGEPRGNAHGTPYDASCMAYGDLGNNHCARERYGFPLVYRQEGQFPAEKKLNYFKTADQIVEATRNYMGKLFVLEVGGGPLGGVSHMALYFNGDVYECTTHQVGSACIKRNIAVFMANKAGKIIYLFGPR
jgi:hypothetical protein